ncbi:unnamed protein product [Rhizophagus irregularis]|nr:unnamed protein product [Rhizophagus irregularis]CAB5184908.1 unnamed protein product [Rhizophagus irregularis]
MDNNIRCCRFCFAPKTNIRKDEHKDIIKENIVKTITSRGFFHDINSVLKVLKPLKKTILSVEASNTTFADCFIALIRLASTINKIPVERGLADFRNHAINSINKRWESFDIMPYILAYFLHPGYRGNGLKNMWTKISEYTQKLWENMGYNISDQEILISQMLNFKAKQDTYSTAFVKNRITSCTWWMSCKNQPPFLKNLALKIFAVTPHNALYERIQDNDDIQKLIDESVFFESEIDDDHEEDKDGYEEYFEKVEISKNNVYVLIEEYVNLAILKNEEMN